jgi:hypothetical protein
MQSHHVISTVLRSRLMCGGGAEWVNKKGAESDVMVQGFINLESNWLKTTYILCTFFYGKLCNNAEVGRRERAAEWANQKPRNCNTKSRRLASQKQGLHPV